MTTPAAADPACAALRSPDPTSRAPGAGPRRLYTAPRRRRTRSATATSYGDRVVTRDPASTTPRSTPAMPSCRRLRVHSPACDHAARSHGSTAVRDVRHRESSCRQEPRIAPLARLCDRATRVVVTGTRSGSAHRGTPATRRGQTPRTVQGVRALPTGDRQLRRRSKPARGVRRRVRRSAGQPRRNSRRSASRRRNRGRVRAAAMAFAPCRQGGWPVPRSSRAHS